MKNILKLSALFIVSSFAVSAAPTEMRVGLVDYQRALNAVEEGKTAKAQIEKEGASLQEKEEKLGKMANEIQELKGKEAANLLKPADVTKLRKMEEDAKKQFIEGQQAGEKLKQKQQAKTGDILHKLNVISQDISRDGNYTIVFEKSMGAVVYAASATDFTEELIQKYNKQYKSGSSKEEKK
jgi:outer membrane protein